MPRSRTICIVDDNAAARIGLAQRLADQGYDVRSFASAAEFLLFGPPEHASCLLVAVGRTDQRGFALQQQLKDAGDHVPIIFIAADGDIRMAVKAMKAGAIDFLAAPVSRSALFGAIASAIARWDARRGAHLRQSRARELFARLTPRERQVFVQLLAGKRNKQIASALDSQEGTVKVHRSRLMRKLELRTLTELLQVGRHLDLGPGIPGAGIAPDVHAVDVIAQAAAVTAHRPTVATAIKPLAGRSSALRHNAGIEHIA